MTIQPRDETNAELAELAAIRLHRESTDPQHTAGLQPKENTVLTEQWRKSNRSNNNGACVEARIVGDVIEVRNSNDPNGPSVPFTKAEWTAFLGGAADGDFNI